MTLTPQLKDGLPLLVDVGGALLPAVSPNCCCGCPKTTCHDDYGGSKVISQVVYSIDLPNIWDVWFTRLSQSTGEPVAYERTRYTGLDVFDGSYIVNRVAHPDCSWSFPTATETINWESRSWGVSSCPSGDGTLIGSGTQDISVAFPLGAPLNHQIRFGSLISFAPDVHYPCNTSTIVASDGGLSGCIAPTSYTSTATSNE